MPLYNPARSSRSQLKVTGQGLISETFDRGAGTTTVALTAQRVQAGLIGLRAGDPITNIHVVMTNAGSGASGYARVALYSKAGVQLGISADQRAALIGSPGFLTLPLSAVYTVTADDAYYACILTDLASTQPTLMKSAATASGSVIAAGSGALAYASQSSQAAFPTPATLTENNNAIWFGVS